jgi:hypothetical protein
MPRETFSRKSASRTAWFIAEHGKAAHVASSDFKLMKPDEPTPAMQNPEKDPEEWTTGEEPMTGPQRSYLQTLCREAGEEFNDKLTKAEASKKIEELQAKTGRGKK